VSTSSLHTILVVDDDPLLRMLAADTFTDAGYTVFEADSGSAALQLLESGADVCAVFTDIQMPGDPDGLKLASLLRTMCPDCAILVTSGQVTPEPQDLASGARFVPKPYRPRELLALVREMLERT
jgi:CheY-like chemotaxis protein